jgi:hypothetical protein
MRRGSLRPPILDTPRPSDASVRLASLSRWPSAGRPSSGSCGTGTKQKQKVAQHDPHQICSLSRRRDERLQAEGRQVAVGRERDCCQTLLSTIARIAAMSVTVRKARSVS